MSRSPRVLVEGEEGLRGTVAADVFTRDRGAIEVVLEDGRTLVVPIVALEKRGDDTFFLPLRPSDLPAAQSHTEAKEIVPIIAETAEFSKRVVETGRVRIRKTVREHEQVVDEPLYREEIQVERVPIGRELTGPSQIREEGDTTIIPIVEEVLVVAKKLMLREEVRITRRRVEIREPRSIALRAEEVQVERVPAAGPRV